MQFTLFPDERGQRLIVIDRWLRHCFGRPGPFYRLDPVSQLVMGLIGGRTYGHVSLAVFGALRRRFGSWTALRDAPPELIEKEIRAVTYWQRKVGYLKATLTAVTDAHGELTLDRLSQMTVDDALAWLVRLPGVGPKTAATVLNFSTLRKATLVIDTHHLRVLRRLGIIGKRTELRRAPDQIIPLLPHGWTASNFDDHHQLMKYLGQRFCRHTAPICRRCPVRDLCPTGRKSLKNPNQTHRAEVS